VRLLSIFRKSIREQKHDLWVLGVSLAFAPLFVIIYWLMTGGTGGSTSYGVLVINNDVPVVSAAGSILSAGDDLISRLGVMTHSDGSSLLNVIHINDRSSADKSLRNREAASLIIIPKGFSSTLVDWKEGDINSRSDLTFVGDLSNPAYMIAAVVSMTVVDELVQDVTDTPYPIDLVEIPLGASAVRTEFENYIPGLFVFAVILMIFQVSMTPARDIESGALRRLRLTRMTTFEYLGGTSLWLALISVISVLLTFATAIALGFRSQGPLWLALIITVITSLSIIGVGLIVACFSKKVSHAFVIANLPLGFLMFLTGAAFPLPRHTLFSLLGHNFAIYDILPPTHAVIALNKIFTLGSGFKEVIFELCALTLLTLLYFGFGVWLFKRKQMQAE
jgi:ABC-type multidrug transport system permease subunit